MDLSQFNYGEGSAREHASMQPRFLGAKIIVARSFARIHLQNLGKQGVVGLTLANPDDYAKISAGDIVSTSGLDRVLRGDLAAQVTLKVEKPSGEVVEVPTIHALSEQSVQFIIAGSALNVIAAERKRKGQLEGMEGPGEKRRPLTPEERTAREEAAPVF